MAFVHIKDTLPLAEPPDREPHRGRSRPLMFQSGCRGFADRKERMVMQSKRAYRRRPYFPHLVLKDGSSEAKVRSLDASGGSRSVRRQGEWIPWAQGKGPLFRPKGTLELDVLHCREILRFRDIDALKSLSGEMT